MAFFKSLKLQFKKIQWPTFQQTLQQTGIVVVISLILAGFIRLIDVLAQYLINLVSSIGA